MSIAKLDDINYEEFYKNNERYFDKELNINVVKIFSGDCYVTNSNSEMLVTVLGSCISACIRDPIINIGGMNHFLLPSSSSIGEVGAANQDIALRYGSYAMEVLINSIIKQGGMKERLEVKLFGGSNISSSSVLVGSKNVAFIKKYIQDEKLNVISENLGGTYPRKIHYYPATGKVMMKLVKDGNELVNQEMKFMQKIDNEQKDNSGDAELF